MIEVLGYSIDPSVWALQKRKTSSDMRATFYEQVFALKCSLCRRFTTGCRDHWFCSLCEACRSQVEDSDATAEPTS